MNLPRLIGSKSCLVKLLTSVNQITCNSIKWRYIHTTKSIFGVRLYTDRHEWIEVDNKIGTVGISHYAQIIISQTILKLWPTLLEEEALGDVVYAQLPDIDTDLKQKDECGALESVKAASEIYSPVSGKVIEKNVQVEDSPSFINTSCYEKGWLFKIKLIDESEIGKLMTEDQYKEFLRTQESH